MKQTEIDLKNSQFWNELCGTGLARSLGITEITPESLQKFDQAYMDMYPYLSGYVTSENLRNKKVLEIGLGFGTLGQFLALQGCEYYGLDIAEGPVAMMIDRLALLGKETGDHIRVGSALEIPFDDQSFDYVYSIGCLHHTGDLPKSVAEVYRVLHQGGKAIVMLYNRHSFRQLVEIPYRRVRERIFQSQKKNFAEWVRTLYDTDSAGEAAPFTEYVSRKDVRRLFGNFSRVAIDSRNFDNYMLFKRFLIPASRMLNNLGRIVGLDLYIVAQK
jgi:ubiquinone/menaquinone biosynthesis C-methylase UbiE